MSEHLHRDDCPKALSLVRAIVRNGTSDGWEHTEYGLRVDWEQLNASHLSTTEKAAAHVARAVAIVERHGGGFGRLAGAVEEAVR